MMISVSAVVVVQLLVLSSAFLHRPGQLFPKKQNVLQFREKDCLLTQNIGRIDQTCLHASIPLPVIDADKVTSFLSLEVFSRPIVRIWSAIISLLTAATFRYSKSLKGKMRSAAESMESGWKQRGFGGSFARTLEVWSFTIYFAIKYLQVQRMKTGDQTKYSEAKTEIATILTNKLLALGPTFIKLGQLLSTRIDVLPREYINALVLLQDRVPGFSGELAVQVIEDQLGKPVNQIFESFNSTPIAAASLGQVHRAVLNGRQIAVKIQRQGLKKLFDMDLKNIKVLAQILNKFDPKSDGAQRDWTLIYEESAKLLYKEIDYELEARNAIRFKNDFANVPWIKVPDVYLNLTTPMVITMEYVPGIKINDIENIEKAGIDRNLLAKRSAESYLTQLCRSGFFHCDPHPGNLACDNVENGRLIYYDFGMMDELQPKVRSGLVNLIFSIYENEPRELCNALEDIGVLRSGADRLSVEKIARVFLKEFSLGVESGKWTNQLSKEEQREIRRLRRVKLGADLFSVGSDVPFKFPPTFTFVFRAFTTLDGIGKGLDPKYDLTRLAQPYLKELIDLRDGDASLSLIKSWGKQMGLRPVDIANAVQSPRKMAKVEEILTKIEQGDLKIRVRVLESERSFKRMEIVQNNMALAMAASAFINMGLILSTIATGPGQVSSAAKALIGLGALFGIQIPIGLFKLSSYDKKISEFKN